jgi:HK97 family phage prohead protease
MTQELQLQGQLLSFDEDKRELYGLIVPFGQDAETNRGLELFEQGAFDGVDPSKVVLRMRHQDPPTGRMVELEQKEDGAYGRFIVSRTAAGDEQLTLARDGVETGLSIGFEDGEHTKERVGDRIRYRHKTGRLSEVSTTWRPAYKAAAVLQTRERDDMAEEPNTGRAEAPTASQTAITDDQLLQLREAVMTRIDQLEERSRLMQIVAPQMEEKLNTQRQVLLQVRELAEVITTGNEGVVPDTLSSEVLGAIDVGRPFLNNTRQIPAPAAGINLLFPKITQRPLVGVQAAEKDELASRATIIGTVDYGMQTIGGAGDLSMQLIRRSSPQFLNLWLELLGQAYATMAEDKAIDALLAEAAVVEGGELDPAAPAFGGAFTNAAAATGRTMMPDRIFLSTAALAAFIDAVEPAGGGGRALYPGLASIAGVTGGDGSGSGLGFTLRPVWVPELDDETPDIIVGPSRAFVWAEDGTYTLQADVPAKFGRDVGLAGMIWYAPIYPAAFTSYTLPS